MELPGSLLFALQMKSYFFPTHPGVSDWLAVCQAISSSFGGSIAIPPSSFGDVLYSWN